MLVIYRCKLPPLLHKNKTDFFKISSVVLDGSGKGKWVILILIHRTICRSLALVRTQQVCSETPCMIDYMLSSGYLLYLQSCSCPQSAFQPVLSFHKLSHLKSTFSTGTLVEATAHDTLLEASVTSQSRPYHLLTGLESVCERLEIQKQWFWGESIQTLSLRVGYNMEQMNKSFSSVLK